MFTKITSVEELMQMFVESLLNKTDKITKVSPNSVNSGIAYGAAQLAKTVLKEVGLVETHLFPDFAVGTALDDMADDYGIAPRFGASKSSVFVRVFAAPGTQYLRGVQTFSGTDGFTFDMEADVTVGTNGYEYIKLDSQETGSQTNVNALTINSVSPVPTGHKLVVNEYKATGGRDIESDDLFRKRIKSGSNILARGTLSMLEQAFMISNNDVLKLFNGGTDVNGKIVLYVVMQNGVNLSNNDISMLLAATNSYFNLVDMKPYTDLSMNINLQNAQFDYIDIAFRIQLLAGYNADNARNDIQVRFNKVLDFRTWDVLNGRVDWVDLISLARAATGVSYIPDNYFLINNKSQDYLVAKGKLPRVRGFVLYNTDGTVLSDNGNQISSVYYPNQPDLSFQSTVL